MEILNYFWVKVANGRAVRVFTKNCEIVDDFIKACKKELEIATPISFIELYLNENENKISLRPGLSIHDLFQQISAQGISDENPLFLRVKDDSNINPSAFSSLYVHNGLYI